MGGERLPRAKIYHIRLGEGVVRELSDIPRVWEEVAEAKAELPPNVIPVVDLTPGPPDEAA